MKLREVITKEVVQGNQRQYKRFTLQLVDMGIQPYGLS